MKVYRVGKEQYSKDVSGLGAKLYGGRWNRVGTACIYTSQSKALALLEYSVNVDFQFIPPKLCFTTFEIQEDVIERIPIENLPKNWKAIPASSTTKNYGSDKLVTSSFPIISVPSVIISTEFNFIINPNRLVANEIKIVDIEELDYDFRIKT